MKINDWYLDIEKWEDILRYYRGKENVKINDWYLDIVKWEDL